MTADWNFAGEHPLTRLPVTQEEQRIHVQIFGGCPHHTWTRSVQSDGERIATCDTCGHTQWLGSERKEYMDADPVKTDAEIREGWLRGVRRFMYDEVVASELFRTIEATGWTCIIYNKDDLFACSMAKGSERFVSGAHKTKCAAITDAASQVAKGKFPR